MLNDRLILAISSADAFAVIRTGVAGNQQGMLPFSDVLRFVCYV